jgi:hypothetical protein
MRLFRSGRSLPSLALWGFLALGAAVLLWSPACGNRPPLTRLLCGSLMLALLLLGPIAAGLHALRCSLQRVVLDPERGLLLAGGVAVPWAALRAVRAQPAPFQATRLFPDEPPEYVHGEGYLLLIAAQALWAAVYCLLLPAFALLSPLARTDHGRAARRLDARLARPPGPGPLRAHAQDRPRRTSGPRRAPRSRLRLNRPAILAAKAPFLSLGEPTSPALRAARRLH